MAQPSETDAVNADSFLDIVASIVSIMIIMVLMTGLKIRHAPVDVAAIEAAETTKSPADDPLPGLLADEQTVRRDALALADEIGKVQQQTLVRQHERERLDTVVRALDSEVQSARARTADPGPQGEILASRLAEVNRCLAEVEQLRQSIPSAPATRIENYPTPLGRVVEGRELHFQLRGGRITYIPLDKLVESFKAEAPHKLFSHSGHGEFTDTVGPVGDFRLQYTFEWHEPTREEMGRSRHAGPGWRFKHWKLICVEKQCGETADEALAASSQFRLALSERQARDATVTCWTYPDSFDTFRRLKKELYRMEVAVAARPLPDGTPISGAPEGTKSVVE